MRKARYESYVPQVKKALNDAQISALDAMGAFVRQKAHDRCAVKGGTSADGVYVSPWEPSDPRRAGATRRSIKHEVNHSTRSVRIGTNSIIAPDLEKGTARETAKSFLTPAAEENRAEIVEIAKRELGRIG